MHKRHDVHKEATGEISARARGRRAEQVAEWYFRLNGFLAIPAFIIHIDSAVAEVRDRRWPRHARTEADFMGVRFPYTAEVVNGRRMQDAGWIFDTAYAHKPLFVLVEVKAGLCRLNGPWTDAAAQNMQRVLRRLGFLQSETRITEVAETMYAHARWKGEMAAFQYVCVGGRKDPSLNEKFRNLVQIDWSDIGAFLFERFAAFPEKLPSGHVHTQWPDFGRLYGDWFVNHGGNRSNVLASASAVERFIATGSFHDNRPSA